MLHRWLRLGCEDLYRVENGLFLWLYWSLSYLQGRHFILSWWFLLEGVNSKGCAKFHRPCCDGLRWVSKWTFLGYTEMTALVLCRFSLVLILAASCLFHRDFPALQMHVWIMHADLFFCVCIFIPIKRRAAWSRLCVRMAILGLRLDALRGFVGAFPISWLCTRRTLCLLFCAGSFEARHWVAALVMWWFLLIGLTGDRWRLWMFRQCLFFIPMLASTTHSTA